MWKWAQFCAQIHSILYHRRFCLSRNNLRLHKFLSFAQNGRDSVGIFRIFFTRITCKREKFIFFQSLREAFLILLYNIYTLQCAYRIKQASRYLFRILFCESSYLILHSTFFTHFSSCTTVLSCIRMDSLDYSMEICHNMQNTRYFGVL